MRKIALGALLLLLLALSAVPVYAQLWSGVISTGRAVDWSGAGVVGGIPSAGWAKCVTTACNTVSGGTVTSATIAAAIASAPANTYVSVPAGSFTLSAGIDWAQHSNVVVRGQGANLTLFTVTGTAGCNGLQASACMEGPNSYDGAPNNVANWTAGYSQGATSITLSSATSLVANQSYIVLTQQDEATDTASIWNCAAQSVCSDGGPGGGNHCGNSTANCSQQQVVKVTSISGSGPFTVGISPGLYAPNWRSGQSPVAWWASSTLTNVGLENLSLDNSSNGNQSAIIAINVANCWVSGVRSLDAGRAHVRLEDASHCTVTNNYFYQGQSHAQQSYGVEYLTASDNLVVNNIMQQVTDSTPSNTAGSEGNVSAYNLGIDTIYTNSVGWLQASFYQHASGNMFDLWEGNIGTGFNADQVHGTHHFQTLFRNRPLGWQALCDGGACNAMLTPIQFMSGSRYFNLIGNVLGHTGTHTNYQCEANSTVTCATANSAIYVLGYTWNEGMALDSGDGGPLSFCTSFACSVKDNYDPLTWQTIMRWGNYDTSNASNQFNSAEVPSAISLYPNSVPASHTLPASFWSSSVPSFWQGEPWPGIGPDITGGNLGRCVGGTYSGSYATNSTQCTPGGGTYTADVAGEANSNPALDCYLGPMNGPPDGSGGALTFNAATCYPASGAPIVSLSSTALNFNTQTVGTTSTTQTVTVTNTGSATLSISSIAITNVLPSASTQFAKTTTCGSTLTATSSCTITITFTPTYFAPKYASLILTTNAASSPNTITLFGIGTPSGMVLYQGGATHPAFQNNVFGGPINSSVSTYSHLIGSGTGILNLFSPGQYLTGVTHTLNLGCSAASCTGANGTYLDHTATSTIAGGGCPGLAYQSPVQSIDNIVDAIAALGYWNNFILQNTSYGAGSQGNQVTPKYLWSPDWADNLDTNCNTPGTALNRQSSTAYLPGAYIKVASTYLQMEKKTCTNTDTSDIRCVTAASAPACITTTITVGATCTDGSGTNSAVWTSVGAHAPPLDSWCDSTYLGTNCAYLVLSGAATLNTSGIAQVTLTSPATYTIGQSLTVANVTPTYYNCSSGCAVTAYSSSSPWTVTYSGLATGTSHSDTITTNGKLCTDPTSPAGCTFQAHSLNFNTVNAASSGVLYTAMPIPYEQQMYVWTQYIFSQVDQHYHNSIGYLRGFGTRGGEMSQDGVSNWPWYATKSGTACSPASNCSTFTSWEKFVYQFENNTGCGTDFACVGNLNSNPSIEGPYMDANNVGWDNNAIGANHAYSLGCYANPGTAPAWCGTVTYAGGYPPSGKLWHGGDWALQAATTFNSAQSNGKWPVGTLQTTQEGTPGSSPGGCATGTSGPPSNTQCANGSCSGAAGQDTGSMVADTTCTYTILSGGPFPAPGGYPGILPLAKQYLANNNEIYFCDAALAMDPNYSSPMCSPVYSTVLYRVPYQNGFHAFLAGSTIAPVFTSAATAFFTVNAFNTFTVTATGTPTPAFTITSGTLPSGVTFIDNGNSTATLSGTPTSTATVSLVFKATNSAGNVTQSLTLTMIGGSCFGCSGVGTGSFSIGSATGCGPPNYQCSSTSTANTGALVPYFTNTSVQNATAFDPTLAPTINCVTLATDSTSEPSGHSMQGSWSTGSNDLMWSASFLVGSTKTWYMASDNVGGGISIYEVQINSSGCAQIVNTGAPAWSGITGPFAWNLTGIGDPKTFYQMFQGHILRSYTVTSITTVSSPTTIVDFSNTGPCPGSGVTGFPTYTGTANWNSILIPAAVGGNQRFTMAIGQNGQGSANWVESWDTSLGCSTANMNAGVYYAWCTTSCSSASSIPLGTTGNYCYGSPGGATNNIHDGQASMDGTVFRMSEVNVAGGSWTHGVCTGNTSPSQDAVWYIGTSRTDYTNEEVNGSSPNGLWGGNGQYDNHPSEGFSIALGSMSLGYNKRPVSSYSGPFTSVASNLSSLTTLGVNDSHLGWVHPNSDDTFPTYLGATDSNSATQAFGCSTGQAQCPSYLANEIVGLPIDGSFNPPRRFVHTHSCNSSAFASCTGAVNDGYFGAQFAITNCSPDGIMCSWPSSDFGSFGTDSGGQLHTHMLIVVLN